MGKDLVEGFSAGRGGGGAPASSIPPSRVNPGAQAKLIQFDIGNKNLNKFGKFALLLLVPSTCLCYSSEASSNFPVTLPVLLCC